MAAMAEEGEPLLIADAEDERLVQRNAALERMPVEQRTAPVTNALMVPLMQDEVGDWRAGGGESGWRKGVR